MKTRLLLLLSLMVVVACGPTQKEYKELLAENESLTKQNEALTSKVELLQEEVEKYQTTPEVLYAKAQEFIKTKNRDGLNSVAQQLKKYHPASTECQKVTNALASLDKEIEAAAAAEKAKRMKAVNKLKKNFDDVSGVTWYYNPYFTHYNNRNYTSIYMGQRATGKPWLRLKMSYYGDDWIFFDNAYLSYDGTTKEIKFDKYDDRKSDNSGGYVWEWIDVGVSDDILSFLRQMVEGKSIKMRLSGKYSKTRELSSNEINGIKDVLLAYDVLIKGE